MANRVLLVITLLIIGFSPVEAGWKKTVTMGGKTTVTGDPETMAKLEKEKKTKAAYQKEISEAPRRNANDPIRVTFLSHLSEKERKKQNLDKIHAALLKEFEGDPIIKATKFYANDDRYYKSHVPSISVLIKEAKRKGKSADVYVLTQLGSEDAIGRNRKTGKFVATKALAYRAEITPFYESKVHEAKRFGTIFQSVQMVNGLAKDIKRIVKYEIGPQLPSPSAVSEINKKYRSATLSKQQRQFADKYGIKPGDDPKAVLRKLFKLKKK